MAFTGARFEDTDMKSDARSKVHVMVDQLPPEQLTAVENLLRSLLDPETRALALAGVEDEPAAEPPAEPR